MSAPRSCKSNSWGLCRTTSVTCSAFLFLVRCVMGLPAEVGDRIQTHLANCNFMVGCESCWFDDAQVVTI